MKVYRSIPNKIKYYRKLNKLSQRELAKILDVDPTSISKWENFVNAPTDEQKMRIAELFGCSIEDIFFIKDVESNETADKTNTA